MGITERELGEHREQAVEQRQLLARKRASRRMVLKGSTVLAMAGLGGAAAFLEACGGSSNNSSGTNSANTAPADSSGWKDTTGLPEYTKGLSFADAKIDPKWQSQPFTYKYNWRRYNWDVPVTSGGHSITGIGTGGVPDGYFNLMTS